MMKQNLEESNGGRTVVGIDPCSEFLQLAILAPNKTTEFKKLPLSPSITEEIVKSTDPKTTQIVIESYGSYGKLFISIRISFLCLRQISHNSPQFPPTDILE